MKLPEMQSIAFLLTLLCMSASGLTLPPSTPQSQALPLIIWHGLGDNYNATGLLEVGDIFQSVVDAPVYFVRLDDDPNSDRTATYFGNVTEQVLQVCEAIAAHPVLSAAPAVNALGFSQGGQFLRGYVELCNTPPVHTLVTFGSQHNGISRFQQCGTSDWLCNGAMNLLRRNAWSSFVQSRLVPAQYFRSPDDLDTYLENSAFLADINNEREVKNKAYKKRLSSLETFVMYIFTEDTTVIPKESAWFAEVDPETLEVTDLKDRDIYKEDWLGLKAIDERGGLKFEKAPGGHMQLSEELLLETFTKYFSAGSSKDFYSGEKSYRLQEDLSVHR
ncbi:MAG: RNA polymerase II C-terminal domain kinase beta subunit [Chaenotheca gracillima]|nr:MAG: RNA polymerase II C-terminal domain kinase beta subunit [Chaenotheca gracillima]